MAVGLAINKELLTMKSFSKILFFLFLCCPSLNVYPQLSFSVDSLKISEVLWLCQNDAVLTHFAYGPCFNMSFSIKNNSNDTILIAKNDIKVFIEKKRRYKQEKKEVTIYFVKSDSILVLNPFTTVYFYGFYRCVMEQETTTGNNYRLVNFLPQIEDMLKSTILVLEIPNHEKITTIFKNCFTAKPFFVDGTTKETIYNVDN